jgi:hypothetical protein
LARLHVVVGILEDIANNAAAVALLAGNGEFLELRKKFVVDEGKQFVAGDTFRVGGPGAPTQIGISSCWSWSSMILRKNIQQS